MTDQAKRYFNIRNVVAQVDILAILPKVIIEAIGSECQERVAHRIEMRNRIQRANFYTIIRSFVY